MPRITLYNSLATEISTGQPVADVDRWPVNLAAADSEENSGRTVAVRLIGVKQDIRLVSYEFFMRFSAATDIVLLRWFQEFYSDDASPVNSPVLLKNAEGQDISINPYRLRANYGTQAVWMREVDVIDGGLGNVDIYPVTRRMTMNPVPFAPPFAQKQQQSLHVPLAVNANWARLAFWIDFENSTIDNVELVDLFITAIVGGHTEYEYLRKNPAVPYVYNFQTNAPLPIGAKVIKKGGALG